MQKCAVKFVEDKDLPGVNWALVRHQGVACLFIRETALTPDVLGQVFELCHGERGFIRQRQAPTLEALLPQKIAG